MDTVRRNASVWASDASWPKLTRTVPFAHESAGTLESGKMCIRDSTLAGELSRAGYYTQCIGKMHVHPLRNNLGFHDVRLHDG